MSVHIIIENIIANMNPVMFPRKVMNPTRFDTVVDVNKASTDVSRCSSSTGVQIRANNIKSTSTNKYDIIAFSVSYIFYIVYIL